MDGLNTGENLIRLLMLAALAAGVAMVLAPILINFLHRIQFWKKNARTKTITGEEAEVFHTLHKEKETTVPRGGGILVWLSTLIVIFFALGLSQLSSPWWISHLCQVPFQDPRRLHLFQQHTSHE